MVDRRLKSHSDRQALGSKLTVSKCRRGKQPGETDGGFHSRCVSFPPLFLVHRGGRTTAAANIAPCRRCVQTAGRRFRILLLHFQHVAQLSRSRRHVIGNNSAVAPRTPGDVDVIGGRLRVEATAAGRWAAATQAPEGRAFRRSGGEGDAPAAFGHRR